MRDVEKYPYGIDQIKKVEQAGISATSATKSSIPNSGENVNGEWGKFFGSRCCGAAAASSEALLSLRKQLSIVCC